MRTVLGDAPMMIVYDAETDGIASFTGLCPDCGSVATFTSPRRRDLWGKFHPHQEI